MPVRVISGFDEQMAEWAREEALASVRFFRALHWRHTPYPQLRGPRLSRWIARRLGVYAENRWVRDPDWKPLVYEWNEDSLEPRTPEAVTSEAVSAHKGTD